MSPRVLDVPNCPHCGAALPAPPPRICPECAGSLQKRHLAAGCLTSKPTLILLAVGAALLAARVGRTTRAATAGVTGGEVLEAPVRGH